jgi:hypothetical protein
MNAAHDVAMFLRAAYPAMHRFTNMHLGRFALEELK